MICVRVLFLFLLVALCSGKAVLSQSPLPRPFEHTYEEIVNAFKDRKVKDDSAGRHILLHEVLYSFDEQGILTKSARTVWRVGPSAIAENGTIELEYSPWYQKQPIVRARVYDRKGKAHEFEKDKLTVTPAQRSDTAVLTNDLVLRAELPGLQEGAIVEEVVTTEELSPFFETGRYYLELLDSYEPTAYRSVEITAMETLPLKVFFVGKEHAIQKTTSGARIRRLIELENVERLDLKRFEYFQAGGGYALNKVAVVVGGSWEQVASAYSKIVDRKLSEMSFASLAKDTISAEAVSKIEKLQASIQWIKKNIHFKALPFGDSSIVPASPMQLQSSRIGDSKDQATFLVGLLREQGIDANVALVDAARSQLPDTRIVGLNSFTHAITVATIEGRQYWIDCSSLGSTIDNVPEYLQGKLALIAAEDQTLTQIPKSSPEINSRIEERELKLQQDRTLTLLSSVTYGGFHAVSERETAILNTIEQAEKHHAEVFKKRAPNLSFRILSQDNPWTAGPEFHETIEIRGLHLQEINYTAYRNVVYFENLLKFLPQAFLLESSDKDRTVTRSHPAEVLVPSLNRCDYKIYAPEGWEVQAKIGETIAKIGGVDLQKKVSKQEDGSLFVSLQVRAQACVLSVDELGQLHEIVKNLDDANSEWNTSVDFREKRPTDGLSVIRLVQKAKKNWESERTGSALRSYVLQLCDTGLVDEARRVALEAVSENPSDAMMHIALGVTYMVDPSGRSFYPGMNRVEAERAFVKARNLDPKEHLSYHYLAMLAYRDLDSLERQTFGDTPKCLKIIKECEEATVNTTLAMRDLQIYCLAFGDQLPEAIALADRYKVERISLALRCFEFAREARWVEVKKLRDRIGNDIELKTFVSDTVQAQLIHRRLYSTIAEFLMAFKGPGESMTLEVVKSLSMTTPEADRTPTTTPQRVAAELIRRIHLSGIQFESWADIISNPNSTDEGLERAMANNFVVDLRSTLREGLANRDGVRRAVPLDIKVEGNDNTGYRCLVTNGSIKAIVFVQKQPNGYQILLPGKDSFAFIEHAKHLAAQGKLEAAVKWIGWCLENSPPANPRYAESGTPAKMVWNLSNKKTPELFDQVVKLLTPWEGVDQAKYAEAKAWIETEDSDVRRKQYWLYLLKNLWETHAPQYADEAKAFLKLNPSFIGTRSNLIVCLIEDDKLDEAKEVFDEGLTTYSVKRRLEVEGLFNQATGEFAKNLPGLKNRVKQLPDNECWSSFLWESVFAGELHEEDVRNAAKVIRPRNEPASLRSLACAEARVGMIPEAVEDLRKLAAIQGEKVTHADWIVVGLIAEECGLFEAALRAYEKVEEPGSMRSLTSSYDLAQIRIRDIRAKQAVPN